jgi:enolase
MPKKYNTYRKNRKHRNKKGGMDNSKKEKNERFRELMKKFNIRSYEDDWSSHDYNKNRSNKLPPGRIDSTIAPGDLNQTRSIRNQIFLNENRKKLLNELKNRKTRKSR